MIGATPVARGCRAPFDPSACRSCAVPAPRSLAGDFDHVLERDDALDSLRDQVNRKLVDLMRHTPDALASALELMLIGRHLERTGDHATNIAEDVFFVVAGEDIRHQVLGS